jgi:hypothetical protein
MGACKSKQKSIDKDNEEDKKNNEEFDGEKKYKDSCLENNPNNFKSSQSKNNNNCYTNLQPNYPSLEDINTALNTNYDTSEECSICLEPYSEEKKRQVLLCNHCFCAVCITKALEINPHCPLCRKKFPKQNVNSSEIEKHNENEIGIPQHISFQDWNVNVVRNHFASDDHFNNNNGNIFQSEGFRTRARERLNVFQNDPFFNQNRERMFDVFKNDPFFNRRHDNVFKNDPFFNKKHDDVFKNDPFFNKKHDDVFKNDPFFNKKHGDVFKNDPFFNRGHNDVFKNDPFFNRNNNTQFG